VEIDQPNYSLYLPLGGELVLAHRLYVSGMGSIAKYVKSLKKRGSDDWTNIVSVRLRGDGWRFYGFFKGMRYSARILTCNVAVMRIREGAKEERVELLRHEISRRVNSRVREGC